MLTIGRLPGVILENGSISLHVEISYSTVKMNAALFFRLSLVRGYVKKSIKYGYLYVYTGKGSALITQCLFCICRILRTKV